MNHDPIHPLERPSFQLSSSNSIKLRIYRRKLKLPTNWHNNILAQQHIREWTFSHFKSWKVGDKVWLETRNLKLQVPSRKLSAKQTGLFEITQVISSITFRLKLPKQWKIHDMFHASLLSLYREMETLEHGLNFPQLLPELIGTEEEYQIDKIINHQGTATRMQYLIHWKGYSDAK